ncbi:response regulator transcription factor [Nitratifractor sp.]
MEILLLEDDYNLAESLRDYLELEGHRVESVASGEAVFDRTFERRFDLYILDINVPDVDGFEVLRFLKEADDTTPAIYISAMSDIASIARGFDLGAVDYLKKPFDPEELVLRIRRFFPERERGTIRYGSFRFDPDTGEVHTDEGERYVLGEVQRRILGTLLRRIGEVVPYDELMEAMEHPSTNGLRVTIAKLKKKLPLAIEAVRGVGYRLENA